MNPERWKQVDEVFAAALERGGGAERAAFLDAACADDAELRAEVESLLAAHEGAADFIEAGAFAEAAKGLAREAAGEGFASAEAEGTSAGRRFGPYEILSLLGAGGMGEVYLARDVRLNRKVALKVLPARFTDDAERVRRFVREARAASALSHPGIVAIYDIGREGGLHYIAAEYVEGRTLRRLIDGGRPALRESLDIAAQAADALAAAHAAGIVHRDIKPDNLMVRADGYVKVLDFGIAKLAEGAGGEGASQSLSEAALTGVGAVVGTAAYMSPEQALGREVDERTDVFSLGVVLYELVAGRHPFRGPTPAATFDAVLNRDPPPASTPDAEAASELERVLARALEKDRELRYQTASDLRADLKRLRRALDSATSSPARAPRDAAPHVSSGARGRKRVGVVLASVAAVAAAASAASYFALRRPSRETKDAPAAAQKNLTFTALTDQPGTELYPSLSPDGNTLVYAVRASGDWDIFSQRVGGRSPRNLTEDSAADDTQPAFSPDGARVAFRSEREGGGLFVMGAEGESVRRLTDFGYHPAWSPDGRELVFCSQEIEDPNERKTYASRLWTVNVSTGERRQLTTDTQAGGEDAVQPRFSPSGARVVYWSKDRLGQRDIYTVPSAGGAPVPVTDDADFDWSPVWSPDGRHVYFSSDRGGQMNLWRVAVDEQTGKPLGPPEAVTTPSPYAHHVSFARDSRRAVFVSQTNSTNIYRAAFNPYREALVSEPVAVTRGLRHTSTPDLSPDGGWFAYSSQGERQEDIYVVDKDGALPPRQLTDDAHRDRDPRWSPDGRSIVFYSNRTGHFEAWAVAPDGSNLRQLTFTNEGSGVFYPFFSPDGARLAYNRTDEPPTVVELGVAWNDQTPRRLRRPPDPNHVFWASAWSPDGRRLGGWVGPAHRASGLHLYDLERDAYERLTDYGSQPRWFADGRRLLFVYKGEIFLADSETRRVQRILSPAPHRVFGHGISKDNRTLYYGLATTEADIWLID